MVAEFTPEQLDTIPSEGWSAGQVAEHIIKATSGFPAFFNGRTEKSERAADEKTEGIRNLFLDFSIKMESPEFILPTHTQHNRNEILETIKTIEKELLNIAETQDLSLLCLDFELPGFGSLTKYEWISFGLAHTERHIHQLTKILQKTTGSLR